MGIMTKWQRNGGSDEFSVIHFVNSNIKIFYSYFANNKRFNILTKNSQIVENMDF